MVLLCAICRKFIRGEEIAIAFGNDVHGRLWLLGLCREHWHDPATAGAPLFAPGIDVPALEEPAAIDY